MTLMRIKGLRRTPDDQQAVVVLEDVAGQVALAFYVPMNEANRLARVLGLTACRCAPVYELIVDLIAETGSSVARVVLDYEADGIYATLVLERNDSATMLRCHPADAIALALRARSPIYAAAAVLHHACPQGNAHDHGADATPSHVGLSEVPPPDVAQWVEGVRPEDFRPGTAP